MDAENNRTKDSVKMTLENWIFLVMNIWLGLMEKQVKEIG
jgi:hypothetical protein